MFKAIGLMIGVGTIFLMVIVSFLITFTSWDLLAILLALSPFFLLHLVAAGAFIGYFEAQHRKEDADLATTADVASVRPALAHDHAA